MDGTRIVIAVLFVMVTFIDASIREPRDVTCPAMFDDFPGKVKYRRRGSRAVFKCPKKMRLHGKKRLDCQPDGTWDNEPPICITSGCVPFDTSSHVHLHTRDRYSDGSLMIFSCTGNYQLVGTTEAICNGHDWSATLPQCLSPKELVECDFESDLCGWSQDDGEERDWVRMMGPTQTGGTGPTYDHTYMEHKSGHYMYFEASNPTMEGDRARLISPTYPPAFSGKCFDLWYHMQGPDDIGHVGSLSVYVKGVSEDLDDLDPAFYIDGNQGDRWHRADLQLDDKQEDFQIVIEATKKLSYISDVALDDVRVYACEDLTTTSTTPSTTSTQSTASTASTISTTSATTTTATSTTITATTTKPPTTTTSSSSSSTAASIVTSRITKPSVAKTTEPDTSTTMPTQRQETSPASTSSSPPPKTTAQITSSLQTQSSKGKSLTTLPTKKSQTSTVTTPKPTPTSSTKIHTTITQSVSTKAVQTTPVQITTVTHKPFTTTSQTTKARTTGKTTTTSSSSSLTTTKQSLTTSTFKTTSKPTVVTHTTRLESRPDSTSPLTSTSKIVPKQTTGVTENRSPKATTTMVKTPTETVTTAKQSIASTTKIPDTARPFSTSILGRKTTTTMSTTAKATTSAPIQTSTVPKSTGKPTDKVTVFTTGKVSTRVTVSTPNLIDKNITDTSNNKTHPDDDETNVSDSRSQHPSDETLKPLMIGLGVGIVVGLIIIGVIVWFCRRRRYYTRGFEDEMKPITNSASLQSLNGQYYADEYHDNEEFESES